MTAYLLSVFHSSKHSFFNDILKERERNISNILINNHCLLSSTETALGGLMISQPRKEVFTSTLPLLARIKPPALPVHKLATLVGMYQILLTNSYQISFVFVFIAKL